MCLTNYINKAVENVVRDLDQNPINCPIATWPSIYALFFSCLEGAILKAL